jgi:hypothetical protein
MPTARLQQIEGRTLKGEMRFKCRVLAGQGGDYRTEDDTGGPVPHELLSFLCVHVGMSAVAVTSNDMSE